METFKTIEYDRCEPVALVEYKHVNASAKDKNVRNANNTTLARLATRAGLPAFLTIYDPDTVTFRVKSMNYEASQYHTDIVFSEDGYKDFLKELRLCRH